MFKNISIFSTMLILLITTAISASCNESPESYLLLNDNIILNGRILGFKHGFLYFKQPDKILKISPIHFKGIFSTNNGAENAIIFLDEPPDPIPGDFIKLDKTYCLIYQKAAYTISQKTSKDEIMLKFSKIKEELTTPENILDINVYKTLLLLSAVSDYYKFKSELNKFISGSLKNTKFEKIDANIKQKIKIKIKAVEYLIDHPYIKK